MAIKKISLFVFMCLAMLASLGIKTQKKYAVFHDSGPNVCFKTTCFSVEIASAPKDREKGLMDRPSLAQNRGMLFTYGQSGIYSFWMKNTLIPLDIVWLDHGGKAIFIKQDAQPCKIETCPRIVPNGEAQYVFEVNAGIVKKLGLTIGSKLDFINVKTVN